MSQVTIERTFHASLDDLWKMWTTREGFASWWAPEGFRTLFHTFEARLNGQLLYDIIAESPEVIDFLNQRGLPISHPERCRFSKFHPQEQLELAIMMDFIPGIEPYENTITVEFFPINGGVRMAVTQGAMHSDEFREICIETLGRQFAKLERQLAADSPGIILGRMA